MGDKMKIEIEGKLELAQVIGHLESVLTSLKEGAVKLSQGGETMVLTPCPVVDFSLEASQKKDKEKLEISLSWKRTDACPSVDISGAGPAIEG